MGSLLIVNEILSFQYDEASEIGSICGTGLRHPASPLAADGKIYCTSEENGVFVLRAGPEYELITVNPVGEICMATPAITNGLFIIRGQHHLFCIGVKK